MGFSMGFSTPSTARKLLLIEPPAGGDPYLLNYEGGQEHRISITDSGRYVRVGCTLVDKDALRFILKKVRL